MKHPWILKLLALAAVLLLLLWALAQVGGVVAEREARLREAQAGVANSLAGPQMLAGPILQRLCTETWETVQGTGRDRTRVAEKREFTLKSTPGTLGVDARATMEPRHRGIFRVQGYALRATLTAQWADLAALQPVREHPGSQLACAVPTLGVEVADARGIRSARVQARGIELAVAPGGLRAEPAQGFHASLKPLWPQAEVPATSPLQVLVTLDLAGSQQLAFAPVGEQTQVRLSSDWPHPSFSGRFAPIHQKVDEQGFDASWQVSALASTAARDLRAGAAEVQSFSVGFIDPVNAYVLSDRATKYGLLFIVLTFVAVGLVEVLRRLRVHPVQYLLVGSALTVFFLLLVSLSEHLPFNVSYLAASAACTLLLAYYGSHVLGGWRAGAGFGAALGLLYGALYVLLQLEQKALVLGSVLLFVVLAAVMVATRKLDWYGLAGQWRTAG
ncbi:MAG TPA: cell envelope integrity protein CreD [Burkholderiaceae bacterium]|nr:cell envelope integrity protein CreD [Burkholderiaceae bacterium]